MVGTNLCRLCINICEDYINLCDEYGHRNETYEITVKYFDPMFLNVEQGNHLSVLCLICWRHVIEFHQFRQFVLLTQAKMLDDDKSAVAVIESHLEVPLKKTEPAYCGIIRADEYELERPRLMEESNEHASNEIFKDEVEQTSTQEREDLPSAVTITTVNDNFFLAGEADITSLNKSTPKISFKNCMSSTEPITKASIEENNTLIANIRNNTSSLSENILSNDATETLSQDYEDAESIFTGELNNGNINEPMDISEYDLESLDSDDSLANDYILPSNYKSGLRRTNVGTNKNTSRYVMQTVKPSKPYINKVNRTVSKTTVTTESLPPISQDDEPTKNKSEQLSCIRKPGEELDDIIAQWKPNLECLICNESYTSYTLLRQHYRQQHVKQECYIFCCDRKFSRRGYLAEHILLHIDPDAFKCEICNKRFKARLYLYHHTLSYHGITSDKNPISQEYQSDDPSPKSQPIGKRFKCELCNTYYAFPSSLRRHRRKEHKFESNGSIICSTIVSKTQAKRIITQKESDDLIVQWMPNLECVICSETYTRYTLLLQHFTEQHGGGNFYLLCCCGLKFYRRGHLTAHVRIHLDPNSFKCEFCSRCYTRKSNLHHHMLNAHGGTSKENHISQEGHSISDNYEGNDKAQRILTQLESDDLIVQWMPNLECVICSETYTTYSLLRNHFTQQHRGGNFYVLCCCGLKFDRRGRLNAHVRIHLDPNSFKCGFCTRCYTSKYSLHHHMLKAHGGTSKETHIFQEGRSISETRQSVLLTQAKMLDDDKLESHVETPPKKTNIIRFDEYELGRRQLIEESKDHAIKIFTNELEQTSTQENEIVNKNIFVAAEPITKALIQKENTLNACIRNKTISLIANMLSNDATETISQDYEGTESIFTGEVSDSNNDEPMDISEYELETLDSDDSLDILPSNYISRLSRTNKVSVITLAQQESDALIAQCTPNLECVICSETYTSYTLLRSHFTQQHKERNFYLLCCCGLKFDRRGRLTEHARIHLDPNYFKCEFCCKCYATKRILHHHMFKAHGVTAKKHPISQEYQSKRQLTEF